MGGWALVLITLSACNPGAYPIDIFREMHYQPSQRLLEPDRLAPPPDAVPFHAPPLERQPVSARPAWTFSQARELQNPVRPTPENLQVAQETFRVNCSMCHGQDGRGESYVAQRFAGAGLVPPVDLASSRVRDRTDGELYWIVNYGLGGMPPFRDLLTEEQTWAAVHRIREVQGQR